MKKKILFASLLFIPLVIGVSSCGPKPSPTPDPVIKDEITLPYNEMKLLLGNTGRIIPSYINSADPTTPLLYESNDEDVASVDGDGVVTANGSGECIITVSYGKASAKCTVRVTLDNVVPLIRFKNVYSEEVNIDMLTSINLETSVMFNNHSYDFEPTYKVDDETIGSVTNGIFTPRKLGTCEVTVSGTFENYALTPLYLLINVEENVYFTLRDLEIDDPVEETQINLYSKHLSHGQPLKNTATLLFKVFDNGVEKTNFTITNLDEDLVNYDSTTGKMTSKKAGIGGIKLSYTSLAGNLYEKVYPIYVDNLIIPFGPRVFNVDLRKGELPLDVIFADTPQDLNLLRATSKDGQIEYTVIDNKILDLPFKNGGIDEIIVSNNYDSFLINVRSCTAVIKEKEDLAVLHMSSITSVDRGYYVVENDIDATGYEHANQARVTGESFKNYGDVGFLGTLDGQGHTISNITLNRGGLIGNIGVGGTVRNLGLKNILWGKTLDPNIPTDKWADERTGIASYINGGILENIYVQSQKVVDMTGCALFATNCMINTLIKNILTITQDPGGFTRSNNSGFGSLFSMCGERANLPSKSETYLKDTYCVSSIPTTRNSSYYVDNVDYHEPVSQFVYPNVKHYLTEEAMKTAGNTYDNFDKNMWTVNGGMLYFTSAM